MTTLRLAFITAIVSPIVCSALIAADKKAAKARKARPPAAGDIDYSHLDLAEELDGHHTSVTALAISPDSKTLASASYDDVIRLWDVSTGQRKGVLRGHTETIRALRFSPNSALLASGSKDKTIRLWNVAAEKQIAAWKARTETRTLSFSPDGKTLASAAHDKKIRLWNVATGKPTTFPTGHKTWVREVRFSPDGKVFASNGYYDIKIWNRAGKEIGNIDGRATTMKFSDDGKTLTSAIGHKVTHRSVSSRKKPVIVKGKEYHSYKRDFGRLSPDGKTLATIDHDVFGVCRLMLMDIKTGKERTIVEKRGRKKWFGPMWYSPNGKALALWSWTEESVTVVDAATGKQLARITSPDGRKYHLGRIPPIAFSPDGKTLAVCYGSSVVLWKVI